MLVIAHHKISDPASFWSTAEKVTQNLPANLKVHSVYRSKDARTGTCLWEADSAQVVQQYLDKNAGAYAENFCYDVDLEKSIGVPNLPLAEAEFI